MGRGSRRREERRRMLYRVAEDTSADRDVVIALELAARRAAATARGISSIDGGRWSVDRNERGI